MNYILQVWNNAPDFKGSQISVSTSGFEISTFLHAEAVTLNTVSF